jgi:hypothetical protein
MNDNELVIAVKEAVTGVHMQVPAEQIMSRSRAIRARRRIPVVAGALAVVAGTALALTTLLPSSYRPDHPAPAQLTAWTVVKQGNGDIRVTIHELRNPAGLQSTLRADAVPATVTFTGQQNPACQPYSHSGTKSQRRHLLGSVYTFFPPAYKVMVIHPPALPSGAGVLISVRFQHYQPPHGGSFAITGGLVTASPQCTGS